MGFRDGSNKGTASNFVQIPGNVWRRPWQWLDKRPRRKHGLYTDSPYSPRPKKVRQVKSKVKSMLIIFFDISGIVHKEFVLAVQTVCCAYYCDVLRPLHENVRRVSLRTSATKELAVAHDHILPFSTRDFFLWKTAWLSTPTHPTSLCFPEWR
jgi:hypothetical protein